MQLLRLSPRSRNTLFRGARRCFTASVFLVAHPWATAEAVAIAFSDSHLAKRDEAIVAGQPVCSDLQLAEYTLAVAIGPLWGKVPREPQCRPSETQRLGPADLSSFRVDPAATDLVPTLLHTKAMTRADRGSFLINKEDIHFAHLVVFQSDTAWCAHPCESPTWELAAPKPETGSPYLLLEAAIWRQSRKVTLYQFDPEWQKRARSSYNEVCGGKGWGCPAYEMFRESKKLLSVGPWPISIAEDKDAISAFIADAFAQFFSKVHELAPRASIGLTYNGHGGAADGGLFENSIKAGDAVQLMHRAVEAAGKPFSLLNFGTNCAEGRWNMLAAMYPFADWILASDLKVGGIESQGMKKEESAEMAEAQQRLGDLQTLQKAFEDKAESHHAIKQVIHAREQFWQVMSTPIEGQKLEQSVAAFDTSKFEPFQDLMRRSYQILPEGQRSDFENTVETNNCDVLAAVVFIDGHSGLNVSSSAANASAVSLALISTAHPPALLLFNRTGGRAQVHAASADGYKSQGSGSLQEAFKALRSDYASTQGFFDWPVETSGLGFNYLGWNSAPCDFVTPLGKDAPPPQGGWNDQGLMDPPPKPGRRRWTSRPDLH